MRILPLFFSTLLFACGGSGPVQPRVSSDFTPEDARLFEDGVDFVHDPEVLEGRWREDWSNELQARIIAADLVALVNVNTVRIDVDLERHETYRLFAELEEVYVGDEQEDELMLPVREGDAGFGTVQGNDERIRRQAFLLFAKWYEDENGRVLPHWHLSPAVSSVTRRVQFLIERHRTPEEDRRRRVTHTNRGS